MFTVFYGYLVAIYACIGLAGAPELADNADVPNARSAQTPVAADWSVPQRHARADGLDPDIYNGF